MVSTSALFFWYYYLEGLQFDYCKNKAKRSPCIPVNSMLWLQFNDRRLLGMEKHVVKHIGIYEGVYRFSGNLNCTTPLQMLLLGIYKLRFNGFLITILFHVYVHVCLG